MRRSFIIRAAFGCICVAGVLAWLARAAAQSPPSVSKLGSEVASDSRWFVDSIQLDVEDVVSSPLYVASPQSPFRSQKFYLTVAAAGVIWGASFGLDKTIQTHGGTWRTARMT
jgi:hypothetical protein